MDYDVDYFIKKFKAIPAHHWTTHVFFDDRSGQMCALGLCGHRAWRPLTPEPSGLDKLFKMYYPKLPVTAFNDGGPNGISTRANELYQEYSSIFRLSTPKERILAALYLIKEKQRLVTKEIIRYVAVSELVREKAKLLELSTN